MIAVVMWCHQWKEPSFKKMFVFCEDATGVSLVRKDHKQQDAKARVVEDHCGSTLVMIFQYLNLLLQP